MKSKILKNLFLQFKKEEIKFASWKNNHELNLSLSGDSDVDLLIHPNDQNAVISLFEKFGFVEASSPVFKYPNVYHFYCFDQNLKKILHIHLYSKVITGESHTKNYHFPVEKKLLERAVISEFGIPILHASDQLKIFLLRHYIKISCLPGLMLFFRERQSYHEEFKLISEIESLQNLSFDNEVLDTINFDELKRTFKKGIVSQIACGLKLKLNLRGFCRYNPFENFIQRYKQITYRLLNKLFFKNKKSFNGNGKFVAITGLDGSGKSSTVEHLKSVFSKKFDFKVVHVGMPQQTLITWPFRIVLNKVKKQAKKKLIEPVQLISAPLNKPTNTLMALRYSILAYERYCVVRKGLKLASKGYLVISDRFPSQDIGVMDSKRIITSEKSNSLVQLFSKFEASCYAFCDMPDLILNLKVPVDVSLERNRDRIKEGKETDEEIIERYRINSDLSYKAYKVITVDMTKDKNTCMQHICSLVWENISSKHLTGIGEGTLKD